MRIDCDTTQPFGHLRTRPCCCGSLKLLQNNPHFDLPPANEPHSPQDDCKAPSHHTAKGQKVLWCDENDVTVQTTWRMRGTSHRVLFTLVQCALNRHRDSAITLRWPLAFYVVSFFQYDFSVSLFAVGTKRVQHLTHGKIVRIDDIAYNISAE